MASANSFAHGLNNWVPSDKPVREDFVKDNRLIDENVLWKQEYDPAGAVRTAKGIPAYVTSQVNSLVPTAVSSQIASHTNNRSNPHGVTAAQLGLGNVNNTSDSNKNVHYAVYATNINNASNGAYTRLFSSSIVVWADGNGDAFIGLTGHIFATVSNGDTGTIPYTATLHTYKYDNSWWVRILNADRSPCGNRNVRLNILSFNY